MTVWGRPTVITTDLVAQTEFTYRTDNLLPDTEVVQQDLDGNGTMDFQRTFVRQYDGLLRSTGYVLKSAPTTTEQSATYGYDAVAGRYASVAAQTLSGPVYTFTYSYDAARPRLLSTMAGPVHTVTNTREADRDILDTKTNTATVGGSTVVSSFDYAVNNIGQRTSVAATGTAFAASSGWTWGYDSLGQVTSAAHTGNTALNQGYGYDDIGNRTQSSVGLSSPAVTNYTANMLNQYSAITGALAPAVNPSYDADGNQLAGAGGQAHGQTFEWDGENRLKAVKDSLGNALVTFAYDAQSRRIRRTTSTGSTLLASDHGFHLGEKQLFAKRTLWERATHVPLIFVGPGVGRGTSKRPVGLLDIYPTLTEICGLPTPPGLEGESLGALLKDPSVARTRPAITGQMQGSFAVRTEDWRYIRYADG